MRVTYGTTTTFGAELVTAAPFAAAAGHWIQLWLYQGDEVIAGSGGQDIYQVPIHLSADKRITATGRRFIRASVHSRHETGALESPDTAAPAHIPIRLPLPVRPLILGITGNLITDPYDLARRFFFNIYLNGHSFLYHFKHPAIHIYWDHHGCFQIPLNIGEPVCH
jgi:hypothetical protein